MHVEYLVLRAGLAALLLSLVVWTDAQRITRRAPLRGTSSSTPWSAAAWCAPSR